MSGYEEKDYKKGEDIFGCKFKNMSGRGMRKLAKRKQRTRKKKNIKKKEKAQPHMNNIF